MADRIPSTRDALDSLPPAVSLASNGARLQFLLQISLLFVVLQAAFVAQVCQAQPPANPFAELTYPAYEPVRMPDGIVGLPLESQVFGPNGETYIDGDAMYVHAAQATAGRTWQWLPDGFMYRSYLAGTKEPRFAGVFHHDREEGWLLDVALGGRAGILRYGTADLAQPEGWQLDLEGAAFPRLDLEDDWEMLSTDFRFGVPLTFARGAWQGKIAYYHLSSHLGDELILRNPERFLPLRINYSRDVLVVGGGVFPFPALRLYAEAGWALASDVARPWEFQFGFDYSPRRTSVAWPNPWPDPFVAMNVHLREEADYSGTFTVQAGMQVSGPSGHRFRLGGQYLTGPSNQFEFFPESEEQLGLGIWYDY